jgi:hypothetical protein
MTSLQGFLVVLVGMIVMLTNVNSNANANVQQTIIDLDRGIVGKQQQEQAPRPPPPRYVKEPIHIQAPQQAAAQAPHQQLQDVLDMDRGVAPAARYSPL